MCARSRSGPKEAERHDGYAVAATVRGGTGIDDDGVEQGVAQLVGQPVQVRGVTVFDRCVEPHLDGQRLPVVTDDDEVDLVVTVASS
jgi:hypothetical protein